MSELTNKDLLEIILKQTKKNAEEFHTFLNEQKAFNVEVRGYLESNAKTNQKGLVEQVKVNTDDINQMKTDKKVEKAKLGVLSAVIGAIIGLLSKMLF